MDWFASPRQCVKVKNAPLEIRPAACFFPAGSQQYVDLEEAEEQWDYIYGMYKAVNIGNPQSCSQINGHGDGQSNLWVGGLPNTTVGYATTLSTVWAKINPGVPDHIVEADIEFNSSEIWHMGRTDCLQTIASSKSIRQVAVHEMGHAIGLRHVKGKMDNRMAVMRHGKDLPTAKYCAANSYITHPDDAAGGRRLYPAYLTDYDIGLSPWWHKYYGNNAGWERFQWEPSDVNSQSLSLKCPGDQVEIGMSIVNRGQANNGGEIEFYLSTDKTFTQNDIVLGSTGQFGFPKGAANGFTPRRNLGPFMIPSTVHYDTSYYVGAVIRNKAHSSFLSTNDDAYLETQIETQTSGGCP